MLEYNALYASALCISQRWNLPTVQETTGWYSANVGLNDADAVRMRLLVPHWAGPAGTQIFHSGSKCLFISDPVQFSQMIRPECYRAQLDQFSYSRPVHGLKFSVLSEKEQSEARAAVEACRTKSIMITTKLSGPLPYSQ